MVLNKFKVLDHGHVILHDHCGNDNRIVEAARISYDGTAGVNADRDAKLIKYLLRNRHTSPFEHVSFTFVVKAPLFVFRQWHRHRTWSYNEVSARYTQLPAQMYVPEPEHVGVQSKDNKQVREFSDQEIEQNKRVCSVIQLQNEQSYETYQSLLHKGVPRELARSVLPLNIYSEMYATVDLHNLLHFIGLRMHSHAQYEIQQYAEAMYNLIEPIVPVTVQAWNTLQQE